MIKKDLNINELLDSIEKEMELWTGYYNASQTVLQGKVREILNLKDDFPAELIQKKIDNCKSNVKIIKIEDAINKSKFTEWEAQIALRTLTWVRELMTEEENNKDTKEDE